MAEKITKKKLLLFALIFVFCFFGRFISAAEYQSKKPDGSPGNFRVYAPTPGFASMVGDMLESQRAIFAKNYICGWKVDGKFKKCASIPDWYIPGFSKPVEIFVYIDPPSIKHFRAEVRNKFNYNGIYQGSMILRGNDIFDDIIFSLNHELWHMVFASYIGDKVRATPMCLSEGMAVYFGGSAGGINARIKKIKDYIDNGGNMSLFTPDYLDRIEYPKNEDQIDLFYAKCYLFVRFLSEKYNRCRVFRLAESAIDYPIMTFTPNGRIDKYGPEPDWARAFSEAYKDANGNPIFPGGLADVQKQFDEWIKENVSGQKKCTPRHPLYYDPPTNCN